MSKRKAKNENLTLPPTHYVPEHDGYIMIATNVPLFHEMCEMPLTFDLARLDEGGGIRGNIDKGCDKIPHKL